MLGPAIGYALASLCLKFYISPSLTPTVGTDDPRWLGAWWLGKNHVITNLQHSNIRRGCTDYVRTKETYEDEGRCS